MQKHVNLVDLDESFPTNILLQNLASIQERTSPLKFAHLAEKSGKGSISNLSTKAKAAAEDAGRKIDEKYNVKANAARAAAEVLGKKHPRSWPAIVSLVCFGQCYGWQACFGNLALTRSSG